MLGLLQAASLPSLVGQCNCPQTVIPVYSGYSAVSLHFLAWRSKKDIRLEMDKRARKESSDLMVWLCAPQGAHKVFLYLVFFKATRCSGSKQKFDLVAA